METWGQETRGQIVGRSLYGGNDEELGEITDIVSREGSNAPEAVVNVGQDQGMGERQVLIPFDRIRTKDDQLVTEMTKDEITQMSEYGSGGYQPWQP